MSRTFESLKLVVGGVLKGNLIMYKQIALFNIKL